MSDGIQNDVSRAPRRKPRSNRRRRNPLPIVLVLLSFGLVGEGVYALLTSPRFEVSKVDVRGNQIVPQSVILKMAALPRHANLFLLRGGKSLERIRQLPRVESVSLHRRLPNRVILRIEERKPVAILAAGTRYYLVDNANVPFSRLDRNGYRLPVLRLSAPPVFTLGKPLKDPAFLTGVKTLSQIKGLLPGGDILQVDPHLNLCLNREDFSVRLGQPDHLDRKLRLLKGLLQADPGMMQKAQYVDLSAPDNPAMMPRDPVLTAATNVASY